MAPLNVMYDDFQRTERCGAENCLSIPNCVDKSCAGPSKRPANRIIVGGKEGDLSAP